MTVQTRLSYQRPMAMRVERRGREGLVPIEKTPKPGMEAETYIGIGLLNTSVGVFPVACEVASDGGAKNGEGKRQRARSDVISMLQPEKMCEKKGTYLPPWPRASASCICTIYLKPVTLPKESLSISSACFETLDAECKLAAYLLARSLPRRITDQSQYMYSFDASRSKNVRLTKHL